MARIRDLALFLILLFGLFLLIHLGRRQEMPDALSRGKAPLGIPAKPDASGDEIAMHALPKLGSNAGLAKEPKTKEARDAELDGIAESQNSAADIAFTEHVVVAGDTLSQVATMYDTSVSTLQELNGLYDPHSLLAGEQLIVSVGFSGPGVFERALEQGGFVAQTIGMSASGHPIESYQIGTGQYHVVLVGAIHGGYEWNTALLAYRMLAYLSVYPNLIPPNVTLHIIPIANPDGIVAVTGDTGHFVTGDIAHDTVAGRLNGNDVDLNRNWGCDWSPVGQWRETSVSGGTRPISEPETRALRDTFNSVNPFVVIWLHSAAGLVVPGNCNGIEHEPSRKAGIIYGAQAGYPVGEFNAYRVTGDAADWLAQHKIASFTVELSDHQNLEFERNLAGLSALLAGIESLYED